MKRNKLAQIALPALAAVAVLSLAILVGTEGSPAAHASSTSLQASTTDTGLTGNTGVTGNTGDTGFTGDSGFTGGCSTGTSGASGTTGTDWAAEYDQIPWWYQFLTSPIYWGGKNVINENWANKTVVLLYQHDIAITAAVKNFFTEMFQSLTPERMEYLANSCE